MSLAQKHLELASEAEDLRADNKRLYAACESMSTRIDKTLARAEESEGREAMLRDRIKSLEEQVGRLQREREGLLYKERGLKEALAIVAGEIVSAAR